MPLPLSRQKRSRERQITLDRIGPVDGESAGSVCWDEAEGKPVAALKGVPYVQSTLPDGTKTNSLLEAHRVNSPYIVTSKEFQAIKDKIGYEANKPFDRRKLAAALLKYDPCSLLHGVFLEKVGGVVRLPRAISAFVEADDVEVASAGGVKVDRVQPGTSRQHSIWKSQWDTETFLSTTTITPPKRSLLPHRSRSAPRLWPLRKPRTFYALALQDQKFLAGPAAPDGM